MRSEHCLESIGENFQAWKLWRKASVKVQMNKDFQIRSYFIAWRLIIQRWAHHLTNILCFHFFTRSTRCRDPGSFSSMCCNFRNFDGHQPYQSWRQAIETCLCLRKNSFEREYKEDEALKDHFFATNLKSVCQSFTVNVLQARQIFLIRNGKQHFCVTNQASMILMTYFWIPIYTFLTTGTWLLHDI